MNRRTLLLGSIALPFAACSTTTPVTVTQLQTDARLVVSGLAGVLAAIATITTIPAATVAQVQGYFVQAQAAADAIAATANPTATVVQQIVNAVQAVAGIVLPLIPGVGPIATILQAAVSMIPALLAAVGVTGAQAGQPPSAPRYRVDEARAILRAGAHR